MSATRSQDLLDSLAALVSGGSVVALTGAGISTDSGIPDYRGDGRRLRHTPMTYQEFVSDPRARRRYWARSHVGWRRIAHAQPNISHHSLAELEDVGAVIGVITQNVDGLHTAAGSRRVVELHGNLAHTICLDCGDIRSRLELQHRLEAANPWFGEWQVAYAPDGDAQIPRDVEEEFQVVDCLECGGVLKPDVVFFGENVPKERVDAAFGLLNEAKSLLVLGSSLTVMSGYRFVIAARKRGVPVAIVNRGPSRGDGDAAIRIDDDLANTLEPLARRLVVTPA
ncbi:MAG TPA: NAD-dependent protein deacetylase [Acidimicrobiia bacterium]|jgi:NAD-dependent SIR2 family protein deacetylase